MTHDEAQTTNPKNVYHPAGFDAADILRKQLDAALAEPTNEEIEAFASVALKHDIYTDAFGIALSAFVAARRGSKP